MDSHEQRMAGAIAGLNEHTATMVTLLASLPSEVATRRADDGAWSPAQHGHHVALTTAAFASILLRRGPLPVVQGASDYAEDRWSLDAPPTGVEAPPFLVPPRDVTSGDAIRSMQSAAEAMAAVMAELTEDQVTGWTVTLPWGTVSLYQLCEWGGGHTRRHVQQVRRMLGH